MKNKGIYFFGACFMFYLIIIFQIYSAIYLVPGFYNPPNIGRRVKMACFANQKSIKKALEKYKADNNTEVDKLSSALLNNLSPALLDKLVKGKYMAPLLPVPRFVKDSSKNYFIACNSEVCCFNHGFVQHDFMPPNAPVYEQLKAIGETRQEILSRASHDVTDKTSIKDQLEEDMAITNHGLWPFCLFLYLSWLPLAIWDLKKHFSMYKIKLGALFVSGTGTPLILGGETTIPLLLFFGVAVLLSIELLIFTLSLLFGTNQIKNIMNQNNLQQEEKFNDSFRNYVEDAHKSYLQLIKLTKMACVFLLVSLFYWQHSEFGDVNIILLLSLISVAALILGATTGAPQSVSMVTRFSKDNEQGQQFPVLRTIFVFIFLIWAIEWLLKIYASSGLVSLPAAILPLIVVTCFFMGRWMTVKKLNMKFTQSLIA